MIMSDSELNELLNRVVRIEIMQETSVKRLEDIFDQTQKTNGRVRALEKWKIKADIFLNQLIDSTKPPSAPPEKSKWYHNEKLVGATVAFIMALVSVIAFLSGQ